MVLSLQSLFGALIFILPAYIANAVPVVLGGGTPIDLGRKFKDGTRIFGDGKTIRGFLVGVLGGAVAGYVLGLILPGTAYAFFASASMPFASAPLQYALCGLLLGFGTMLGDLAGSFIKRRLKMERGQSSIIMDQLFFMFFALAFALPLMPTNIYTFENIAFLVCVTYIAHIGSNFVANRLGLKKVPW